MARVVNCEFLRFSCGHDLFNATYTRSNRTKGTKIMRCFPHCCPEHMPRCYCGCSLQVLVQFEDVDAVRVDDLLVCARFETSEQQEPRYRVPIGSALTIPKSLLSTNPDDANATAWVLAEKESEVKQRGVAKNSVLYVMNNHRFPRWYYSYESGATKNQREMRHHLTVYILQRTRHPSAERGDVERVQVIGRLASPAFKLVSYRRARGEVKKPAIPEHDDPLAALEDQGPSATSDEDDDQASASSTGTPTKIPPPRRQNSKGIESDSGCDSPAPRLSETRIPDVTARAAHEDTARPRSISSPHVTVATKAEYAWRSRSERRASFVDSSRSKEEEEEEEETRKPSAPRKRKATSPAAKTLWWRQHSEDAQRVLHLHVLFVMLNRLSLHDVMFCLREKSDRLRKKWFETIVTKHCDGRVTTRLDELARAFCLSAFAEDATRPSGGVNYAHSATRTVIATCLDVLVEVAMSDAVAKLLQVTWDSHQTEVLESEHIRVLFIQFVRRLHGAIDATVRNRRKSASSTTSSRTVASVKSAASGSHLSVASLGLAGLVDDAMTAVFREKALLPLRRDMAHALSNSTWAAESWYRVFVAQLRVAWVKFNERKASGINLLWQAVQKTTPPLWNGKWLLDTSSFRVRRPGGWLRQQKESGDVPPLGSAVSWIVLLRQWMAVELTMDGMTLSVSSLLTNSKAAGLKLVLDGRQRVFMSHPDGLASTIGCGGGDRGTWLHGDYIGRSRDDSSELLCETYSIRQKYHAEILRLAIKASIWSAPDGARRCVVAVQLASATCENFSAEHLHSWPVAARHDRLYAVTKWNVLADVEATYHDLK